MSPPSLITSVYRIRYASGYYVGENIGGRTFYGTIPGKPFNNDTDFDSIAEEMLGCLGEIIAVDFDGVDVLVSVNEADDHAA
jgi:hypothetical protein